MLRVAGGRCSSLSSWWSFTPASSAIIHRNLINDCDVDSTSDTPRSVSHSSPLFSSSIFLHHIRGLSSGTIAPTHDLGLEVPATVTTIKNPTSKITYD